MMARAIWVGSLRPRSGAGGMRRRKIYCSCLEAEVLARAPLCAGTNLSSAPQCHLIHVSVSPHLPDHPISWPERRPRGSPTPTMRRAAISTPPCLPTPSACRLRGYVDVGFYAPFEGTLERCGLRRRMGRRRCLGTQGRTTRQRSYSIVCHTCEIGVDGWRGALR